MKIDGWFGIIVVYFEYMLLFTTKYDEILKKVDSINPVKYSLTRNFKRWSNSFGSRTKC